MTKKTAVLALHGFTGCGEDFDGFSPLCHSLDHWHCPNLPGHGAQQSHLPIQCDPAATLQHLEATLTDCTPTPDFLIGYSMGARASLQFALTNPARWKALILISPNPGIQQASQRERRRILDNALAERIEREGVPAFIQYWQETPLIQSQQKIAAEHRARMQANRVQHCVRGLAASLREFGQGSCPNLQARLSQLTMPILILTGANDPQYTKIGTKMADHLPSAKHITIEGAGHMPHLEAPSASATAVDQFIETVQPRLPGSH
ncbi:MAG: alpha/beta fold hydrolase [Opitutales bacterium]